MVRKEYSAGAVKHSFWFFEFRKMTTLIVDGCSIDDIRQMAVNENIFAAPTGERSKQIFATVSTRVQSLDERLYTCFLGSDVATQKTIALVSIMNTDALFFDFMNEVYCEKLILGDDSLTDSDIRIFFKNKQVQSEKVAKWQDYTLKRLGSFYKNALTESGMAHKNGTELKITRPVLDSALIGCLQETGMCQFINVLTGVRR